MALQGRFWIWTAAAGLPCLAAASAASQPLPSGVTPDMVQRGDGIFHDRGRCFRCHGSDAKGTTKAPPLVAPKRWVDIHGDYQEIVRLVDGGVPDPKEHPAPMPKRGNAKLSDADVRDVAAYVWAISHRP
jgi:mono/diheme cytochrome c family protein